uniref:Reverse transcriptase domain-containing protein n=1 Tax=Lactuca sativa TaxID=4236 RepID=A0A9R1VM72_LACSA|nr:hypothetical protein LSAT_V11C400169800 [Lactuca sativa]
MKRYYIVEKVVCVCGNDRAWADGFTFAFIKRCGDKIGEDIFMVVQRSVLNTGSNALFITLIPKCNNPLNISDFHPTNLIGSRLKNIMPSISVRCNQLSSMVDFEKAFDTLNWNYLDDVIRQMTFGEKWRKWVLACISSLRGCHTTIQRQGDPLSLSRFIIATEGLRVALAEALDKGLYKGVNLTNNGPNLSTFRFADDTLFLGEWNISNALNLMRLLRCFHICFGLKINIAKCRVMGIGMHKEEVMNMATFLGCKEGTLPFYYLGMSVDGCMSRMLNQRALIENFQNKLSNWKARCLSFG